MHSILTLVHDDVGQESRLQAAFDLARQLDAHLVCLDVARAQIVPSDFVVASEQAIALINEQEREADNLARLTPRLLAEGVSHTWHIRTGDLEDSIVSAARLVDLIILTGGREGANIPPDVDLGARVADRTHVPVLLMPHDHLGLDLDGTAVVAWDGSHTSAAAIRSAVPLLQRATDVVILTIGDDSAADATEAASYLARYGCRILTRPLPQHGSIADTILAEAKARAARLIIMGSYGHGRWRERLFGGTSRDMMVRLPYPVLIAR